MAVEEKKMFYSSLLDCMFESKEEADEAEEKEITKREKEEAEKKAESIKSQENEKIANRKKELALKVEEAESKIAEAREYNKKCDEEAQKICDDAEAQIKAIRTKAVNDAKAVMKKGMDAIREAENNKCTAIRDYNEEFGTYKKYLTGKDAQKEFTRINEEFDRLFDKCFGRGIFDFWF